MRISDWSSDVCSSDLMFDADFQHLGPEAPPVAIRTAQVYVGQELHLDMLEASAAAGRAAAVAAVEAEGAGGIAAFFGHGRLREQLADGVESAHVAGRIRTRGLEIGRAHV